MRDYESEVLVEDGNYELYWIVPGGDDRQNKLVHASKFTKHSKEITNTCSFHCESDYQEDYDEKYWINKFSYCFRIYTGGSEPLYLYILSYYENLTREDFIESY